MPAEQGLVVTHGENTFFKGTPAQKKCMKSAPTRLSPVMFFFYPSEGERAVTQAATRDPRDRKRGSREGSCRQAAGEALQGAVGRAGSCARSAVGISRFPLAALSPCRLPGTVR